MDRDVIVREVGLRDGLQGIKTFFSTEGKKAWIDQASAAGIPVIEATSFVNPKLLPQFIDAEEVLAHALQQSSAAVTVLVPHAKAAERAFAAGAPCVSHFVSASESFSQSNVKRTIADALEDFRGIVSVRNSNDAWQDRRVTAYITTAFGCSIEGPIEPTAVLHVAEQLVSMGAQELYIGDTVGYGNPNQVRDVFRGVQSIAGDVTVGAHFHDTRGLGLANVTAALDEDITMFDASLAGLGGCPFAPGASGNIVTEDLVYLLESMGLNTGISIEALCAIRPLVNEELPHETLRGSIAVSGLPKTLSH